MTGPNVPNVQNALFPTDIQEYLQQKYLLSDCHTATKTDFRKFHFIDSIVLSIFCLPLYARSFSNVHPKTSKQTIPLTIRVMHINFIKFYAQ